MPDSDEDVLERSLRQPAAFEELVRRHSVQVHGYLRRRSEALVADDLLSETWLQAFTARSSYDAGRGPVRAWVFGVARHVLSAHQRRHRREPRQGVGGGLVSDAAPDWDAVDARLDAAASAPALRTGLARLSGPDRELLLVVWEQLAPTEAAAVLGIPPGTARSRLHRARRQLRDHVTASPGNGPDPVADQGFSRRSS